MRIAITGGTGFVGRHLARALAARGHQVVLIARGHDHRDASIRSSPGFVSVNADVSDESALRRALEGCDAVAHCAGINREIGHQTYRSVHVEGTRNLVEAARAAGLRKVLFVSFLRARPNCGSPYHESKWEAEEIVRRSGMDYTILRPGVMYGRGDHMLDHLSHAFYTFPFFALVGIKDRPVRPMAVNDVVRIMTAALVDVRLSRKTIAVVGPEVMLLADAVRRVSRAVGRTPIMFRMPLWLHRAFARFCELTMQIPLVSLAQVRILSEGVVEPALPCDPLPADLAPTTFFTSEEISKGLPDRGSFGWKDLRCCHS